MGRRETSRRRANHCPPQPVRYPWLLYSHGKCHRDQTFCTILSSSEQAERRRIPELRGKTIMACSHGWLILSDNRDSHHYSLWNLVTYESIRLPPLKLRGNRRFEYCLLSSPPGNPGSMVLLFTTTTCPSIFFCGLRRKKWDEMQYGKELDNENDYLRCPVSCKGKLYATTHKSEKLVLIDVVTKPTDSLVIRSLKWHLPFVFCPRSCRIWAQLVESCGELFYIYFAFEGIRDEEIIAVDIFKLDFSTMMCEEVEQAKDRVFFWGNVYDVGDESAVSCSAVESGTEGGFIHFIYSCNTGDKSLYSYNIEDKSISLSLPWPDLPTRCRTQIWVMPESSRLCDVPGEAKHKIEKDEQGNKGEIEVRENGDSERMNVLGEKREAMTGSPLFDLPHDILKWVARHLINPIDYLNFRATCKFCRFTVPPIQWKTASARFQTHSLSPWLVFPAKDSGILTFMDPKVGDRYFITVPGLLGDAIILYCSKDGWLLMLIEQFIEEYSMYSMIFFNPFSKAIIQLPKFPHAGLGLTIYFSSFGFSSLPTSSDCLVVGIMLPRLVWLVVYIARPGGSQWDIFEVDNYIPSVPCRNSPIFYDQAFHFLGHEGDHGVLKVAQDGVTWRVLDDPKTPCSTSHKKYLVECDGDLLSVFVGKFGKWVQVFKLNSFALVWDKVESLGNHTIFVSDVTSFSTVARTPGMENKIYFPKLFRHNVIYYSLDTGKYHTFGSKEPLIDFYDTKEQLLCGWIEPKWSSDD